MIIKKTHMKDSSKSRVTTLVNYLKSGNEALRQDMFIISNCCTDDDIDLATEEISVTQQMNTRCKTEKTVHYIFSFPHGEKPHKKDIESMINTFKKKMGYGEAQTIAIGHNDTDNYHVHVVLSRIDRNTHKAYSEPIRDYKIMADCCAEFEKDYLLREDKYIIPKGSIEAISTWEELHKELANYGARYSKTKEGAVIIRGDRVVKASILSDQFSIKNLEMKLGSFKAYAVKPVIMKSNEYEAKYSIKALENRIDKNKILAAKTWKEFHHLLNEDGFEYVLKGAGAIFKAGDQVIKASTLGRAFSLSNLVKKFGQFEKVKENKVSKFEEKPEFRTTAFQAYQNYKSSLKHSKSIALKDLDSMFNKNPLAEKIKREKKRELMSKYKVKSWIDWLKEESLKSNPLAVNYLRNRSYKFNWSCNYINTFLKLSPERITNRGTAIFSKNVRYSDGKVQISDYVKRYEILNVLRNIDTSLELKITGSEKFKLMVIKESILANIELKSSDSDFNFMYKSLKFDIDKKKESRFYIEKPTREMLKESYIQYDKQLDRYYITKVAAVNKGLVVEKIGKNNKRSEKNNKHEIEL